MMTVDFVEKKSKKGNNYVALEISITEDYKKVVFLDNAELALIKATYNK